MATPEPWLRGPVEEIPALLQPVAHALLDAREEVEAALAGFSAPLLWERPARVASVGFHLRHLAGVLDRLFTYARGEPLSPAQLATLAAEETTDPAAHADALVRAFGAQVDRALAELRATDTSTLTDARAVGRSRLPSTVLGLLVHAAEHTQRHVGQLLVTVRVVKAQGERT